MPPVPSSASSASGFPEEVVKTSSSSKFTFTVKGVVVVQMVVLDVAALVPKNRPQYLLVAPLAFGLVVIEEMYPPGISI